MARNKASFWSTNPHAVADAIKETTVIKDGETLQLKEDTAIIPAQMLVKLIKHIQCLEEKVNSL